MSSVVRHFAAVCVVASFAGCQPNSKDGTAAIQPVSLTVDALPAMMVYKSPTCGCCSKWVDYLRAAGMEVKTTDIEDMGTIKERFGVPARMASCHTAVIGGYVVEGHVPLEDIRRLLAEQPKATGISAPGMPIGSPGMEVEGRAADRYDVMVFGPENPPSVFASH